MIVEITWKKSAIVIGTILIIACVVVGINSANLRCVNDFKHDTGIGAPTMVLYGYDSDYNVIYMSETRMIPGDSVSFKSNMPVNSGKQIVLYSIEVK